MGGRGNSPGAGQKTAYNAFRKKNSNKTAKVKRVGDEEK
jgi:hypothetical protein